MCICTSLFEISDQPTDFYEASYERGAVAKIPVNSPRTLPVRCRLFIGILANETRLDESRQVMPLVATPSSAMLYKFSKIDNENMADALTIEVGAWR